MNLNNLELFKKVAEVGNITKAAKQLHMTQPSISMQIKRLEERFGVPLIVTHPKGIKPTDAGMVLLHYCDKFNELQEQMMTSIDDYREGNKGYITIGAPIEIRTYLFPIIRASFINKYPGIQLEEKTVRDGEIEGQVRRGTIDIGFTLLKDIDHLASRVTLLTKDPLQLISGRIPSRTNNLYFYNEDLMDEKLSLFQRYDQVILADHAEMAKRAVMAGLGDGIVSASATRHEVLNSFLYVKETVRDDCVSIITRPAEKLQNSVRIFISHVLSADLEKEDINEINRLD